MTASRITPSPPDGPRPPASASGALRALPRSIWALGFVSMFMDISSELIHSLLPVFMATTLGASMVTIGVIEGIAEAAAAITKVASGVISDFLRKRKLLVGLGYSLGAVTKPIFPLATTISWVFGAHVVDRIGKGIRSAPRDALVADITPARLRGAAYGLRQTLDSVGSLLGPLLAVVFMSWLVNDIKAVMWVAVVPGFAAVLLLIVAVREPERPERAAGPGNRLTFRNARYLSRDYWLVVVVGAVFALARFSEAFLILRARDVGLAVGWVPTIMIVMNASYAVCAFPAGAAADRIDARALMGLGLGFLVVADVVLAMAGSVWSALLGAAFWGLHMAFTQGLLSKLVADSARDDLRGTAFGIFNLVSGVAVLLASVIAGSLWSSLGAPATFVAGAAFAALAAAGVLSYPGRRTGTE